MVSSPGPRSILCYCCEEGASNELGIGNVTLVTSSKDS